MRKFVLMLTAAMFMLATSVYGTEKSKKKLDVKPFNVINVMGSIEVVYEQGSTYEVCLVGDAAAFNQIKVGSNGSDLNISKTGNMIGNVYVDTSESSKKCDVIVEVKAPDVSVFNIAGSGQLVVGKMKSTAVTFNQAGSGKIAVSQVVADHVKADYVGLTMNGSGTITSRIGKADNLNCVLTGSGCIFVSGKVGSYKNTVIGSGTLNDSMLKYDKLIDLGRNVNVGNTYNSRRQDSPDGVINARP